MTEIYVEGPDTIRSLQRPRRQQFANFQVNKAKQFVASTPTATSSATRSCSTWTRQRRAGRPPLGAQLGAVPRRDRRLRRHGRARRAHRGQPDRPPQGLPLPGPGPERDGGDGEGDGRSAAGDQVLQHGRADDRRPPRARAAPRHVGRARASSCSGRGRRARRSARRSSRRARTSGCARSARASTRRTRSSRAGSRARCRRSSPASAMKSLPRVAAGQRLRGDRLARRELLLRRHLRLLPDPARPRLLAVREVRPRLHRPRRARGDGGEPAAAQGHARLERRGRRRARWATLFEKGEPAKYIDLPLSNYSTWPNDKLMRRRRDGRRLDLLRLQLQRALDALARRRRRRRQARHRGHAGLGRGERRLAQAGRRAPRQTEIRAIVSPVPTRRWPRTTYAEGWRTTAGAA